MLICLDRTKTGIKPMSKTNVGANFMFARRTKTFIKPMFENEFETIASDIGITNDFCSEVRPYIDF